MDWLDYREKLQIGFDDEKKFKYFRTKIFNVLYAIVNETYSECVDFEEYYAFCNLTGTQVDLRYASNYDDKNRFRHCLTVLDHTKTLDEFIAYYIALTNSVKIKKSFKQSWIRENFANLALTMLEESHIPVDLINDSEEYYIFPKGVPELDDALVSQPLTWLSKYTNSEKAWIKALKAYSEANESNASEVADKFRKALETFLHEFFNQDKTLEKLKPVYGKYLKDHGIPSEISNNFETLLLAYTNFINNCAKHHDKTQLNILEYIMYQSGNIIRLLITLKDGETE